MNAHLHSGSEDGLLRKSIVSIVMIGGGCALFLSVLGTASFLVGRSMSDPSTTKADTSIDAPGAAPSSSSSAPGRTPSSAPNPARKSPTAI